MATYNHNRMESENETIVTILTGEAAHENAQRQ
jgi:hypothetical protein